MKMMMMMRRKRRQESDSFSVSYSLFHHSLHNCVKAAAAASDADVAAAISVRQWMDCMTKKREREEHQDEWMLRDRNTFSSQQSLTSFRNHSDSERDDRRIALAQVLSTSRCKSRPSESNHPSVQHHCTTVEPDISSPGHTVAQSTS